MHALIYAALFLCRINHVITTVLCIIYWSIYFTYKTDSFILSDKAGKSKCKIKIDNSSVILLNDKSDFPRLSPRPSLLNLVDKVGGRRKSMQQQLAPSTERDLCALAKDSPKKGILKFRARSNSESGRGALSSPLDGPHLNGILDGSGYSGLSTPIIINRKSSLSSPVMANHVRNILNSLEDRVNQMNGSCSRVSGRGSIDAESIAEEEEDFCPARRFGRRVHSIDETAGSREHKMFSSASKRRASLQHQRCVDEDDGDSFLMKTFRAASSYAPPSCSRELRGGSSSNNLTASTDSLNVCPQLHSPRIIPTTIQVDPPSIHSSYSLSSSASSSSNFSNRIASSEPYRLGATTSLGIVSNGKISPQSPDLIFYSSLAGVLETKEPSRSVTPSSRSATPESQIQTFDAPEQTCTPATASLKPKTVRTPSDIENQNNITLSESSDICESQSNDADTRNTSIEEIDDFDTYDTVVTISNTDDSVISGTSSQADLKQLHTKPDGSLQATNTTKVLSSPSSSKESNGTVGKSPKSPTEARMYSSAKCTSADIPDSSLKSDSVSNLLI